MNGRELMSRLESLADPGYRDFQSKLVPGETSIIGVRMPSMRSIAKEICRSDWRGFLEERSTCYEFSMVRAIVIGTAEMDIDERIDYTNGFIPEITNWAINDTLCSSWSIGKMDDPEKLWKYCKELISRHEEFPSRLGAVLMMTFFIDDRHVDEMNELLVSCPRCGYYLDMGIAWALSFCFIKYPEKTEKALFGGGLEKEILSMTVRKICDSYRVDESSKMRLKYKLKEFSGKHPQRIKIKRNGV